MGNFKGLRVWQESIDLAEQIYMMTRKDKFARDFGLKDQIQRAAVSIASNIAEGDERMTVKEAIYFLNIAKGSSAEVITQLYIAKRIGYISKEEFESLENRTEKISSSIKKLLVAKKQFKTK